MKASFNRYTKEITQADLERLFTRETPEAYRYFARDIDHYALAALPWYKRYPHFVRQFFMAFAMRQSPARRASGVGSNAAPQVRQVATAVMASIAPSYPGHASAPRGGRTPRD